MLGARGKSEGGFDLSHPGVRQSLPQLRLNDLESQDLCSVANAPMGKEGRVLALSHSESSFDGFDPERTGEGDRSSLHTSPCLNPSSTATAVGEAMREGLGEWGLKQPISCSTDGGCSADGMSEEEGGGIPRGQGIPGIQGMQGMQRIQGRQGAVGGGEMVLSEEQLPLRKRGRRSRPSSVESGESVESDALPSSEGGRGVVAAAKQLEWRDGRQVEWQESPRGEMLFSTTTPPPPSRVLLSVKGSI
ncbi:MAG: hypothetical protein SGPRY_010533 [Prymnesium sp.]